MVRSAAVRATVVWSLGRPLGSGLIYSNSNIVLCIVLSCAMLNCHCAVLVQQVPATSPGSAAW